MTFPDESQRQHLQDNTARTADGMAAHESQPPAAGFSYAAHESTPHLGPRPFAESPSSAARLTDPPASWPRAAYAGAKVLIVENEDSNRMLLEKILTLVGYECVSASNGQEALEVFERELPQIVLTDISMPVMDGYEEIARLRALPEGAHVPIVVVTAHAMSGDREYALREGCNEYVVKPYRPRDLVEVVDRLLKEVSV
jgi:CheY-like chemotaxis protein